MTEPRTPGDPGQEPTVPEPTTPEPTTPDQSAPPSPDPSAGADSPTQPWPSLSPSSETAPSAASWGPSGAPSGAPSGPATDAPAADAAPTYEPADRLPDHRLDPVAESGTFGAPPVAVAAAPATSRSRSGLRWGLAILGIVLVLGATALIVFLAGGRPATSGGIGYMPATTVQYSEIRLDLPGDQRQKLAGFLASFPGFKDQSQIEPKLNDVFDRLVRAVSNDKQTYSTDIAPWFGGQVSIGMGIPQMTPPGFPTPVPAPGVTPGAGDMLVVVGIKDKAKADAWITSTAASASSSPAKSSYNGTDIWTFANATSGPALALNDKVMLLGTVDSVHAAIDTKGEGTLGQSAEIKAAMAQVDRDYVFLTLLRTKPYVDAVTKMVELASPGALSGTQLDETISSMLPAWQASFGRFENDALVSTSAYPSVPIGYDSTNHKGSLLGHVPATTILYAESHDVGPALTAMLAKFRALPEAKAAFQAYDQAVSILGGSDAVLGWWGDTAFVVAPGADGVIGGGIVIQPRDKAAADRLLTTLRGFLTLAGSSTGLNIRDEDHNGTKITILDFSAVPGTSATSLPPGYKAEFAYAVTNDVAVLGYGRDFVASVIDSGAGANLAADERFRKLVSRVGEENMGLTFVDVNAIRGLIEPIIKQTAPEAWTSYETDIKPYVEHLDALISAVRKDNGVDRGTGALTTR
jgi:hypothetical protein